MATYFTLLKYTAEGAKGISADRTTKAKELIENVGGKFVSGYGLLGQYDAVVIAEYPDEKVATKAALRLAKLIGASSQTLVAIPIDEFDQLAQEV